MLYYSQNRGYFLVFIHWSFPHRHLKPGASKEMSLWDENRKGLSPSSDAIALPFRLLLILLLRMPLSTLHIRNSIWIPRSCSVVLFFSHALVTFTKTLANSCDVLKNCSAPLETLHSVRCATTVRVCSRSLRIWETTPRRWVVTRRQHGMTLMDMPQ